jgi:MSHA biogenesis protein MshO
MSRRHQRAAGFTLVEMITVIAITGILASMVAVFMRSAFLSYFESTRRAELVDHADVVLRRMARELRLAVPNSLRIAAAACPWDATLACNFIEFIPTSAGARYRDAGDGSTGGNILSFTSAAAISFDVLDAAPAALGIAAGDLIVVNNLGPGYDPANAYGGGNRATVGAVAGQTITLTANVFAAQSPPLPSPNSRFHVVPGAVGPVSYVCSTTSSDFRRYAGYGFLAAQPTAALAGGALVVENTLCNVGYAAVNEREGLLFVSMTVAHPITTDVAGAETVTVFRQIHVDNTP